MLDELFSAMQQRYRSGDMPWNQSTLPPEIIAVAERIAPGRMLDLGCGTGRVTCFFAQHGWMCDGVDFVPEALELARQRATEQGVAARVHWHQASIPELDFLQPAYDLAIDIGCLHAQPVELMPAYVAQLQRLLRPGATFLLFGRLFGPSETGPRGLRTADVERFFQPAFSIEALTVGSTTHADATWQSGWWSLRRR